ncbi:MAG: S8 family peptidase [Bacillota bacterium]
MAMKRGRPSVIGFLASLLVLFVACGAAGPPTAPVARAKLHPAVAKQIQTARNGRVSVIVTKNGGASGVEAAAEALGARITARWTIINGFAADLPARSAAALASLPGVRAVLPNSPVAGTGSSAAGSAAALSSSYVYAVQAEKVWAAGYQGDGVSIAIVDSGLHFAANSDFSSRILNNVSFNPEARYSVDKFGHGTHVGAIAGGDGSNSSGKWLGIAPRVNLLNVKFSDDYGNATEKDLVSALQWVYDNRITYNIRVVNISAQVGARMSYKESPTAAAVEQLWFSGVVVVASAGNRGTEDCSVCYPPGADPFIITVGAVDDRGTAELSDDLLAAWSSRGSTLDGHAKPDVMAPGAHVVAYMPSGTLRSEHPDNVVDDHYFRMGGTSMASPVVAGGIALLLQARPALTPDQVKWLVMNTTRSYEQQPSGSAGILDLYRALAYDQPIGEANQGLEPSPLLDPGTNTITYESAMWSNAMWSNSVDY